jgi:hypothetical protein
MFCNNRLVMQAVASNDVASVKKLLADYDFITNPFQSQSFTNVETNPLQHVANVTKNKEIMQVFIKSLLSSKQRKPLESTLLSKFDSGNQGHYNFNVHIKEIHQARVRTDQKPVPDQSLNYCRVPKRVTMPSRMIRKSEIGSDRGTLSRMDSTLWTSSRSS